MPGGLDIINLKFNIFMPGTRIGQASECFVYWKDPATSDTWGLNFTSPIDAKQFRECCVSAKYQNNNAVSAKQFRECCVSTKYQNNNAVSAKQFRECCVSTKYQNNKAVSGKQFRECLCKYQVPK